MTDIEEIDDFITGRRYRQVNSVLVWQDGEMLVERYYNGFSSESRNVMRSVVKSILSIATGICLNLGYLKSLNEPVYKYLEEFSKGIHPYHRAITIKHLLTMSSGIYWVGGVHYHCPQMSVLHRSSDWIEFISQVDMSTVPGTRYNYSEFDVILLTAVLQAVTRSDVFTFINENIYAPLDIHGGPWWKSSCGIPYSCAQGGEGNNGKNEKPSNLTAREMLHIGQLFLQNGFFNGKQILSKTYVQEAISPGKLNPEYGYLWWLGEDWYGCRGFGGQSITVVPRKNKIIVVQATPTARGMAYEDLWKNLI